MSGSRDSACSSKMQRFRQWMRLECIRFGIERRHACRQLLVQSSRTAPSGVGTSAASAAVTTNSHLQLRLGGCSLLRCDVGRLQVRLCCVCVWRLAGGLLQGKSKQAASSLITSFCAQGKFSRQLMRQPGRSIARLHVQTFDRRVRHLQQELTVRFVGGSYLRGAAVGGLRRDGEGARGLRLLHVHHVDVRLVHRLQVRAQACGDMTTLGLNPSLCEGPHRRYGCQPALNVGGKAAGRMSTSSWSPQLRAGHALH